jgi:SAM-dependent methyltransferase
MAETGDSLTDAGYLARQYGSDAALQVRIETHRLYGVSQLDVFDEVCRIALLRAPNPSTVLDIGAGNGNWYRAIRRNLPPTVCYQAVDQSAGMVGHLTALIAQDPLAQAQVGDAEALGFPQESFDWVGAHYMLYHVPDIGQAVGEAWRAVKPGGILLAATNGRDQYRELAEIRDLVCRRLGVTAPPGNAARFDLDTGPRYFPAPPEVIRWPSGFVFDRPEPILRYMASGNFFGSLESDREVWPAALELAREAIEERIRREGQFVVHSETGILWLHKPTSGSD